jgi:glutamate/tyrosine decarboxylase-like PLP-dependent enzyme
MFPWTRLERSEEVRWDFLDDVAARSKRYLEKVGERRVAPDEASLSSLSALDVPLQDHPLSALDLVEELDRIAAPATVAMAGPRFFGYVNGGALPGAVAANLMLTAWEQHGAFEGTSPATTRLEQIALGWIRELLALPQGTTGGFVTGTTVAHVVALSAARDTLLSKVGWNCAADGLAGSPPLNVVVGGEGHSSLFKALGVVGLGRKRIVSVPIDDQGRLRAESIPVLTAPSIVCVQSGNVNTGAFDPIRAIAERVRRFDVPVWIHVDGAFGLWARVAPARAHLADGLELADSWATDAHKWLNSPYDCGIVLARDGEAIRRSMAIGADYLPSDTKNPIDYVLEMSRRSRGVDVWAVLRSLGRSGLAEMVERHCRLAARFADAFRAAGYPILNDVVLNQVLVSFGDADMTRRVVAGVQADGTCWCGPTVWHGQTAMRVSVINWSTTESDVDRSIAAILRIARDAGARPND